MENPYKNHLMESNGYGLHMKSFDSNTLSITILDLL